MASHTHKWKGKLDIDRVEKILNGEKDSIVHGKGKHVSLGIRNVNERIKLIYGEEYGLTILPDEDNEILSTIVIPYEMPDDGEKRISLKTLLEKH